MKFYEQLSELETELIRLETLSSLVRVISSGFENSVNTGDLQNTVYLLEENIESINDSLRNKFDYLWDCVRNDSNSSSFEFDDEEDDDKLELNFNDNITIGEILHQPLDDVVNKWAKS